MPTIDSDAFVYGLEDHKITPHIELNGAVGKIGKVRRTAVPPEVAASEGYAVSIVCRKRIEDMFEWTKVIGGLAQLKVRGFLEVKAPARSLKQITCVRESHPI